MYYLLRDVVAKKIVVVNLKPGVDMIVQNLRQNWAKTVRKRLPIITWLPQYTLTKLLQDIVAGITVGTTEIPQAIAYAVLAGLPPEYGLYSGLLDGFIYTVFGGCKSLNIGPSSILTLMLEPHVTRLGANASILITFFSGVIIIIAAILQLGILTDFLSFPVVSGFVSGGIFIIASSQLKTLMQIPGGSKSFVESWTSIYNNIADISKWDAVLGFTTIFTLLTLKKLGDFGSLQYNPAWSKSQNFLSRFIFILSLVRNALAVVIGTALAYFLQDQVAFAVVGQISGTFPKFQLPPFNSKDYSFGEFASEFGVSFALIPLISMLEAISVIKSVGKSEQVDPTQEMVALGLCNLCGSFIGSMPVTGSFARSALNCASNVQTTLAGTFTSLLLLATIAFLTPTFYYIPRAILCAILICATYQIFDFKAPFLLWKTKKLDLIPYLSTTIMCLIMGVDYGLMLGLALHVLFVLYASARPKFLIDKKKSLERNVVVITPRNSLLFPAAEHFRQTLLALEAEEQALVVDGKNIGDVDVTVCKSLVVVARSLEAQNHKIVFINFKRTIVEMCVKVDKNMERYFFDEDNYSKITNDEFQDGSMTSTSKC